MDPPLFFVGFLFLRLGLQSAVAVGCAGLRPVSHTELICILVAFLFFHVNTVARCHFKEALHQKIFFMTYNAKSKEKFQKCNLFRPTSVTSILFKGSLSLPLCCRQLRAAQGSDRPGVFSVSYKVTQYSFGAFICSFLPHAAGAGRNESSLFMSGRLLLPLREDSVRKVTSSL